MQSVEELVGQFKDFCRDAEMALERSRPTPPVDAFQRFVELARPLLLKSIHGRLDFIRDTLRCLEPWLLDQRFDLLRVAQLTGSENPYTELVAWAIDPATDSIIGTKCQREWLKSLGVTSRGTRGAVLPVTQFSTDDGIPDLVLHYPDLLVVIEAKTSSPEHTTPVSGEMQTIAYPAAVRRRLGRPSDFRTTTIYLTLDRSEAANGEAIRTSFFELAVCLARTLNGLDVPSDLATLYKLVISHFATQAGVDARKLMFLLDKRATDNQILQHVSSLSHMLYLLPERAAK